MDTAFKLRNRLAAPDHSTGKPCTVPPGVIRFRFRKTSDGSIGQPPWPCGCRVLASQWYLACGWCFGPWTTSPPATRPAPRSRCLAAPPQEAQAVAPNLDELGRILGEPDVDRLLRW